MADFLIKTLKECNQPIPDFFQDRVPEDGALDFNDDSGAEEEEEVSATNGAADAWGLSGEGDAWGSGGDAPAAAAAAPVVEAGWGGDDGGAW